MHKTNHVENLASERRNYGSSVYRNTGSNFMEYNQKRKIIFSGHRTALIDTGPWQLLIGNEMLDQLSEVISSQKFSQMSSLQTEHKFGKKVDTFCSLFSVEIQFAVYNQINGQTSKFRVRADVLEGSHPFIIGTPTLHKIQSKIDTPSNKIHFTVNGKRQEERLIQGGNHLYISHKHARRSAPLLI